MIQVKGLSYSYPSGKQALKDINFRLNSGDVIGITGHNGSGKTTLCHCLCGIIPHHLGGVMEGDVLIKGRNTGDMSLGVIAQEAGIIFQDPSLQIMMPTVEDELAFGLENRGMEPGIIRDRIYEVMEFTGIINLKNENPVQLSGGEKQLVAIAAALALDPGIIIFDEAMSMLDERAARRIFCVMEELKNLGKTMIIADLSRKCLKLADKILVLRSGQTVQEGTVDSISFD